MYHNYVSFHVKQLQSKVNPGKVREGQSIHTSLVISRGYTRSESENRLISTRLRPFSRPASSMATKYFEHANNLWQDWPFFSFLELQSLSVNNILKKMLNDTKIIIFWSQFTRTSFGLLCGDPSSALIQINKIRWSKTLSCTFNHIEFM